MTAVDSVVKEFVRLLDAAIFSAERMKVNTRDAYIIQGAEVIVKNLKGFRKLALSGGLPRPSRGEVSQGIGLGLNLGVGEWTEDDNLLSAVIKLEDYYKSSV